MNQKIKRLYQRILNLGITKDNDEKNKRIRLLNSFCITWGFLIIPFGIADLFFSNNIIGSMMIHLTGFLCLFIVFAAQKKGYFEVASFTFLIILTILITLFTNYVEKGRNIEIVYFLVPLMSLLVVKDFKTNLFFLALSFTLFYFPNVWFNHYPFVFKNPIVILAVFVGGFVILNYSQTLNRKNEAKLELAYKELEEKKKNELAHLQLKSLKAQMNPHFMFNAMNSIQNLVLKGDKNGAYDYLTKFASLIRENLNMSEKSFVSFEEELSLLEKYLELEKLRFRDNFQYIIKGIDTIDDIKIPSMIIQPFVENAIKHGLLHKKEGIRKIELEFIQEEVFKCVIVDNGVGMEVSKKINEENEYATQSFSTKAIQERLELLKEYYNNNIGFSYENVEEGTKVVVKIPYTLNDE